MEEKPEEIDEVERLEPESPATEQATNLSEAETEPDSSRVYQAYLSEESSFTDRIARILGSGLVALGCVALFIYLSMVDANRRGSIRILVAVFCVASAYFIKVTFFPGRGKYATTHGTPKYVELENMSANGGAVGSLVLGTWTIIGALITPWSVINGAIGMALGLWGLASKKPRMAFLGITLSAVGALLCALDISESVGAYFINTEDVEF